MMKRPRGLSLVEVLVALVVLGIVLALAIPSLSDMLNRRRTLAAAEQLMSDIAFARTETGLRTQEVNITFGSDATQSCYTVYYVRAAATCDCTRGQGHACSKLNGAANPGMEFRTFSLPASQGVSLTPDPNSWSILHFDPPRMTANPRDAAIKVVGTSGVQLRVQLNAMGRMSLCSSRQSVGGVTPCE